MNENLHIGEDIRPVYDLLSKENQEKFVAELLAIRRPYPAGNLFKSMMGVEAYNNKVEEIENKYKAMIISPA